MNYSIICLVTANKIDIFLAGNCFVDLFGISELEFIENMDSDIFNTGDNKIKRKDYNVRQIYHTYAAG